MAVEAGSSCARVYSTMAELERVEVIFCQSSVSASQCTPVADRMAVACRSEIKVGIFWLVDENESSDNARNPIAQGLSWSRTSYSWLALVRLPEPDCTKAKFSNASRSSNQVSVVLLGGIKLEEINVLALLIVSSGTVMSASRAVASPKST